MVVFVKVTAQTPHGDTHEYMWMGDLDTPNDQTRLIKFMVECCDDCADRFGCPDEWDSNEWRNQTSAMWEAVDSQRMEFGPPVAYAVYENGKPILNYGGAR